jgi:PST family polysaccharide transporter
LNTKIYKDIFANILTLTINIIVPLALIPILTGALGLQGYGNYMAMLGLVALCVVLSDLGFDMFLSKEVSIQRSDLKQVSKFLTTFIIIKVALSLFFLLVLYLLLPNIIDVNKYALLFSLWLLYINLSIKPSAFYNGLEKYTLLSKVDISGKLILITLIFSIDFSNSGLIKAIVIQIISTTFINCFLLYFLFKTSKLQFTSVSIKDIIKTIKSSFGFYSARLFLNIYNQSSTYLVSLVLISELVAAYAIGIQLYKVGQSLIGAISRVLYTRTVKNKNLKLVLKVTIIVLLFQFLGFPIVYYWGEELINLVLNINSLEIAQVANIFYISLMFVTVASFWGYPVMVAIEREKYAHYGVFFGSIAYFIMFVVCYLFIEFNLFYAVLCILIADICSCMLRIYFSKKFITKTMLLR